MEIKQIYELVNDATKEIVGEENLLQEDLSNLVDVGTAIFNANSFDAFTKKLVDKVGKVVFVIRKYSGSAPSVLMDTWEYGAIKQKIRAEMPEATENESWELEDGTSYDENIFTAPKVSAKFFGGKKVWEIPLSITEDQVKSAFTSASEMNAFLSMLYNEVDKSLVVKTDALIMRTINNMTAETLAHDLDLSQPLSNQTSVRAVNLLKLYNDERGQALTKAQAYTDKEFLRYACYVLKYTATNISKMSRLYNIGGTDKFTPREYLHLVMLSKLKAGADVYLQSDTFHNELTALPAAEDVACWQGTGTSFANDDISKINVKTASSGTDVVVDGILAVMFDTEALGVSNTKRKVTSKYNARAEFTNLWYKQEANYFNDLDENFVVFFIA